MSSSITTLCDWCDEPILAFDRTADITPPVHWECLLRAVAGGVNHQLGICSCCGGAFPPDPPHLSQREAAKAAADLWVINERKSDK